MVYVYTHNIIQDQVIIRQSNMNQWSKPAAQRKNSFSFRWYLRYDAITIKAFSFICFSLLLDHKWSSNALLWNFRWALLLCGKMLEILGFSVEDKNLYCYYIICICTMVVFVCLVKDERLAFPTATIYRWE